MKIKGFWWFIDSKNTRRISLRDTTVVIDGQNYLYQLHKASESQGLFGCESDRYAEYLRERLSNFTKANIKCYFIFKGGHNDFPQWITKETTKKFEEQQKVIPLFMKDVYKQVLDELGFSYSICEFEAKRECIAFAQKHSCALLSFDMMYCFSGIPYISCVSLDFNEQTNSIDCNLFTLDTFLNKYGITEAKLAIFAALTDSLNFPEDYFQEFYKTVRLDPKNFDAILQWIAKNNRKNILQQILRQIDAEGRAQFKLAVQKAIELIRRQEIPGVPTECLEKGNVEILEKDPFWFEKGVAMKHISIPLVNLARRGTLVTPRMAPGVNVARTMLLSMDIIKYIYNLLTNYENQEIKLFSNINNLISLISVTDSVSKPKYTAISSPFENGWKNLPPGLFQHFLNENLNGFNMTQLNILEDNEKLLMLALVYFTVNKRQNTTAEVYSVLLSYVTLNVIGEGTTENIHDFKPDDLKPTTFPPYFDKFDITKADKETAIIQLREYLKEIKMYEVKMILDVKLLEPLIELQHCIQWLNYLSILCGQILKPIVYHKVYSASLVYRLVKAMRDTSQEKYGVANWRSKVVDLDKKGANGSNKGVDVNVGAENGGSMTVCDNGGAAREKADTLQASRAVEQFLENTLSPAPTVLAYLRALFQVHQDLVTYVKNGKKWNNRFLDILTIQQYRLQE